MDPALRSTALLFTLTAAGLAACAAYRPKPWEAAEVLAAVVDARQRAATPAPTFAWLAERLLEDGPDLREARAAWRSAAAAAEHPTPWPNPGLEVGPAWGTGDDVADTRRVVPFVALSVPIPLSGRRAAQDALNAAQAAAARIAAVTRVREAYLELRRGFVELQIAQLRAERLQALAATAAAAVETVRRSIAAGVGTARDVGLLEIETARVELALLEAEAARDRAAAALARLTGVPLESLRDAGGVQPEPPETPPSPEELRSALLDHHAELARLRAEYAVAEQRLRLEVERQLPDLVIGPSVAGDPGERKVVLGLTLGIELPLFDRNRAAIATAAREREALRIGYEATATRALADVEGAVAAARLAHRRRLATEQLTALAERHRAAVQSAVSGGAADALHQVEAQRAVVHAELDALAALGEELRAWLDLEEVIGKPVFELPGEVPVQPVDRETLSGEVQP